MAGRALTRRSNDGQTLDFQPFVLWLQVSGRHPQIYIILPDVRLVCHYADQRDFSSSVVVGYGTHVEVM